jgi:Protein of unknown function (DUF3306)
VSEGFFSRWSQRKVQARDGEALVAADPTPGLRGGPHPSPLPQAGEGASPALPAVVPADATLLDSGPPDEVPAVPGTQAEPPPTLADVALLTRDSDYSRFVAGNVSPEVRNAALKQLFTDPHFNVMDGLDIYIDDYGKPDPLPPGMLRQMVQSHLLGLFDDEKKEEPETDAASPSAVAADTAAHVSADPAPPAPPALPAAHEDPDLQLQPDDGAGRAGPEPGAGAHAGRAH